MASHSGKVSTNDNKSILSVTDSEIENVVSFFKDYMTNSTPKEFKLNNPIILNSLALSSTHGVEFTIGKYDCSDFYVLTSTITDPVASLRYSRSGSENNYIYTKSESGDYYNSTGSAIVPTQNGLAIVYDNRQMLFQNDNTILTRVYNNGWGDWLEVITDANLVGKVSSNFSSTTKLQDLGLLDLIYPVGSIYISQNEEFNPNNSFGGTWIKITNRFLYGIDTLAQDSDFSTGGASTVTLTTDEMPSHTHDKGSYNITGMVRSLSDYNKGNSDFDTNGVSGAFHFTTGPDGEYGTDLNSSSGNYDSVRNVKFDANRAWSGNSGSTGSGEAFSIMPPYQQVYMWKRIQPQTEGSESN